MAVPLASGPAPKLGKPSAVLDLIKPEFTGLSAAGYDVSSDGKRLILARVQQTAQTEGPRLVVLRSEEVGPTILHLNKGITRNTQRFVVIVVSACSKYLQGSMKVRLPAVIRLLLETPRQ